MKKILHIFALTALCCAALLSCGKIAPEQGGNPDSVQVSLRISAGQSPLTKAITESDESGAGWENYIDVSKLHILLFGADSKFIQEFVPSEVLPMDGSAYPAEWELRGPIDNPPAGEFKIVVFANITGTPSGLEAGTTTIEDVCMADWAMCTGYSFPYTPSADKPIPMYGVKTVSAQTWRSNLLTDLGQLDLLRAFTKVRVHMASGMKETLEYVKLKNYNTSLAAAPLGMYDNTANLSYDHSVHLYDHSVHLYDNADGNSPASTALSPAVTSSGTQWEVYVPEYRNVDPNTGKARSDCSSIELKFNGISKVYTINFRDYSTTDDGTTRLNLVRNHIYDFEIASIGSYSLDLTLTAQPWETSSFANDYKKNVGVSDNGQLKWTDSNHFDPGTSNVILAKSAGHLTCTFTISTPVGATWYAFFEEKTGDYNHFKFFDGTDELDSISGVVDGSEVTLEIHQAAETVGSAKLVIYAKYGNINFNADSVLGGPYILKKD